MFTKFYRAPEIMGTAVGGAAQAFVGAEGEAVQLPEGFDPADATYSRVGPDLVLTDADGVEVVVTDFFMQENAPVLLGEGGARIDGALAVRLAGPTAPGEVAGEVVIAEPIGRVNGLTGEVTVVHADGTRTTLHMGDPVFMGDIVESGAEAGIGILLADGTALGMGEDALLVLDEMVYDPDAQEGNLSISVLKGVFTVVSGQISKVDPESMLVHTPMATIGIRGTQVGIDLTGEGGLSVVMMEEADGFVGEVIVYNDGGLMTINQAYYSVRVGSYSTEPFATPQYGRDMLLNTFGVTFAFLPLAGTTGNDYGLQASLAEGLAGFETMAGEDLGSPALRAEGLADFESRVAEVQGEEDFITAAGGTEPAGDAGIVYGGLQEPMSTVEAVTAAALGGTTVTPPSAAPASGASTTEPAAVAAGEEGGVVSPTELPVEPPVEPPVDVTPPVAEPGAVLVGEDNVFTGQLSASDLESGALVFDLAEGGLPTHGTVLISADGSFEYIPDPDFSGSDTFIYQVSDDAGNISTATVTVAVEQVLDLPVLAVADVSGSEDAGVVLTIAASMPSGTTETLEAITIAGIPAGAVLSAGSDNGDGSWTLSPAQLSGLTLAPPADWSGSLTLTVSATSTDGGTTSVDFGVTVGAVADVPVLAVANVSGSEDAGVVLTIAASMPSGTTETLESITIAGIPAGVVLSAGSDNGDGSWTLSPAQLSGLTLTPPADWSGSLTLTVSATSTDGGTTTQDMIANVLPVADQPTLTVTDVVVELPAVTGVEIDGGKGDDVLYGGAGDDIIEGGQGDDVLYGDMQGENEGLDQGKDQGKHDDDGKYDEQGKGYGYAYGHGQPGDDGGATLAAVVVPLDVNAALTDVDGSEALSIEIAGVPDGALLSLGADNGDGTWTLTGEDLSSLDSLTLTLPEGAEAEDFALNVTAISTELDTGETATASGVLDVTFEGGSTEGGADQLYGGEGDDTIYGGGGADVLEGGQGDDVLYGGTGADQLEGGQGDDELYGGAGDDYIEAGQGDDFIEGGAGNDVLVGGQGDDTFVFRAGDGNDIILDLGEQDELRFEGPEFSAEDFNLQTNGDDTATITFGDDAGVSVTLNDFDYDPGDGYTVVQDGDAVVVTFHNDDEGNH